MLEGGAIDRDVDSLRASGFELRLRLRHVHRGGDAALVAAVGQMKRLLVRPDGRIEKLLLRIEAAQLEVIERQLGMKAQAACWQDRRRWLALPSARLRRVRRTRPQTSGSQETSMGGN